VLVRRGIPTRAGAKVRGFGEKKNLDLTRSTPKVFKFKQSLFSRYLQQTNTQSLVANIGREAGRKLWTRFLSDGNNSNHVRYLGHRLVMYGFVGVSLASCQENEINPIPICKHLSELFSAKEVPQREVGGSLEDYEVGPLIAKGCDAAVHEVQLRHIPDHTNTDVRPARLESVGEESCSSDGESFEIISDSDSLSSESFETFSELSSEDPAEETTVIESSPENPLCIKVMFNYGNSSNTGAIERSMRRELVPILPQTDNGDSFLCGAHVKKKDSIRRLPPHPNIIDMYGWFVDRTPLLDGALDMYPVALPLRLCENGSGRNRTMFIVMKRYESTLADYINACGLLEVREAVIILFQLLQAIDHLQRHGIAHRDLKSDNLLLEWREGSPNLVVSDFGHCCTGPLYMPYPNDCMDKGGNGRLMAPEIVTAEPGAGAYLDFRASDSWAAGTIAYELLCGANPFYTSAYDSRDYREEELPREFPEGVPRCVRDVVYGLLRRDPKQRMTSQVAASILALWLWSPSDWFTLHAPSCLDVSRWLVHMSAAVLLGAEEHRQRALFLGQLEWRSLWRAVELMGEM